MPTSTCRACGHTFAGLALFDRHRTGTFRQLRDPSETPARRCRTPAELETLGMVPDFKGRWSSGTPSQVHTLPPLPNHQEPTT